MNLEKLDAQWFSDLVEQIINFLKTAIDFITKNALKYHYAFEEEDTQAEG